MQQIDDRETKKILEELHDALARGVLGDVVELGCYKGDTSVELARILKTTDKKLFLYDSFEGLPEKTEEDSCSLGESFKSGELLARKNEVFKRFLHLSLPRPIIKKAWFNELEKSDLPDKIAFALLDGDFYESIKDSFNLIENKLSDGATVIVDDYSNPALPGAKQATDEWFAKYKTQNKNAQIQRFGVLAIIKT